MFEENDRLWEHLRDNKPLNNQPVMVTTCESCLGRGKISSKDPKTRQSVTIDCPTCMGTGIQYKQPSIN